VIERIRVSVGDYAFIMEVRVPDDRDAEEYIDELLDSVFGEEARYDVEWDFT